MTALTSREKNRAVRDVNQIAARIVETVTNGDGKNPHAVLLGRLGGEARADSLSARRRRQIAKKAAQTRWGGKRKKK